MYTHTHVCMYAHSPSLHQHAHTHTHTPHRNEDANDETEAMHVLQEQRSAYTQSTTSKEDTASSNSNNNGRMATWHVRDENQSLLADASDVC